MDPFYIYIVLFFIYSTFLLAVIWKCILYFVHKEIYSIYLKCGANHFSTNKYNVFKNIFVSPLFNRIIWP